MCKYLFLYLAVALASICIVQSANPTGGTGCSSRWFFTHWCWRYCDASAGKWCYTRSGCAGDEESCANETVCHGWCKDAQVAEGCVVDCPDDNQVPLVTCVPIDRWEDVHVCNNLENIYPTTCHYEYVSGIAKQNKYSTGGSYSNTVSDSTETGGGINIQGISATFKNTLGISETTGNNWANELTSTYNTQAKHGFDNTIPANSIVTLKQVVGRCDDIIVYGRTKLVSGLQTIETI